MTPDLLNFKKGWMSLLDERDEWKKHWFVLTDSSLRYYRDSNAEEADDLEGEIDLHSCKEVAEFQVQRNYGFQIQTKEAVYTLSAMTSGIRRNWIEALRKNVRPTGAPDVTKMSDSNKENAPREYSHRRGSTRLEEERAGRRMDPPLRQSSCDHVELEPFHHPDQQPRGKAGPQAAENVFRVAEVEREHSQRSEERRRWFEAMPTPPLHPGGAFRRELGKLRSTSPMTEEQRCKASEQIEKIWVELERIPLREHKQIPLGSPCAGKPASSEAFTSDAEFSALKMQLEKTKQELNSLQLQNERLQSQLRSAGEGQMVPHGYISQVACEQSLAAMEGSHRQTLQELQRHHQRELERVREEKNQLLAEETAATVAAIEAMKKAHHEDLQREMEKVRRIHHNGADQERIRKQYQAEVDSLKRELQVLSEQYSQKCLEITELARAAEEREKALSRCQRESQGLHRQNQDLNSRLSEEIGQLRAFVKGQGSNSDAGSHGTCERSSSELEVLLRVKENELQYLKKETQCLREELQSMQKDKRFASEKYKDVYVELNHFKMRSEREMTQLREHLRLAMAALQEKETLENSIAE
ncbi:TRIO and F-actin binding protein b [Latimeria chalumnae]|uniref:TRIO and F-actin binding protein b n=1 Tax=Latimeria chalumnae TaxID=7897 RepID=UPI00313DA360